LNEIPGRRRTGGVPDLGRPIRHLFVTQSRSVGAEARLVTLLPQGHANNGKYGQTYTNEAHAKSFPGRSEIPTSRPAALKEVYMQKPIALQTKRHPGLQMEKVRGHKAPHD
jgi:hypothetical protein